MSVKKEKKEFVEPQLIKCEKPLDKVTMTFGGYPCPKKPD